MNISFFCRVPDRKALELIEFYTQDISTLREIDPGMSIATRYSEIDWKADIIFIWWWTYALYPVLRARLAWRKVIITGTFNYRCPGSPIDFFRRPWYQRWLIKNAMRWAHLNILVSKHEYEQIKTDWRLNNLEYSPHGVEIDKYLPAYDRRPDMLFTMCWTAKLNQQRKCLPETIEAMKIIKQTIPDIMLYIGGRKGDGYAEIEMMIEESGLSGNVTLLGEISEELKIQYYQQCSIYLQPSRYEGFGLAIAEAMSCGSAIISTDAGEVKNLVGDAGLIIDSCDPETIGQAVITLLGDNDRILELGQKAAGRIRELFPTERRGNDIKYYISQIHERETDEANNTVT